MRADYSGGAWPGKGEALEGRAGCEETNRGAEVPADKGQRGKRPAEHGPAHHRQVRRKMVQCMYAHTQGHTRTHMHTHVYNTCSHAQMHTNLHMNRFSSSKADIMMKGIIELVSVDFSCQLHNGFSSISTLFIFRIGSPETRACCLSHSWTMSIHPTIKISHYHCPIEIKNTLPQNLKLCLQLYVITTLFNIRIINLYAHHAFYKLYLNARGYNYL